MFFVLIKCSTSVVPWLTLQLDHFVISTQKSISGRLSIWISRYVTLNKRYDISEANVSLLIEFPQVNKSLLKMIRRDLGDNVIEVLHNTGTERWLVVKKQLEAARMKADAEIT